MVKKILSQFILYSALSVVPAFANPDGVVLSGDVRITEGGRLVFSDGSVLSTAPAATTPNPYSNIVSKTCSYAQLKPTGMGQCFCPAAPSGYKALAIQGAVDCGKHQQGISAIESAGMMDDWYGGWCNYDDGIAGYSEDFPQMVYVKCIYVPL